VVINTTNYILFTNDKNAIPVEDTDRRYWIVFAPFPSKVVISFPMNDLPNPCIPCISGAQLISTPGYCTRHAIHSIIIAALSAVPKISLMWLFTELDEIDRGQLAVEIQSRLKELTGVKPAKAAVLKLVGKHQHKPWRCMYLRLPTIPSISLDHQSGGNCVMPCLHQPTGYVIGW
jgi:hypothetical protein